MFAQATGRPDRLVALHFHDMLTTIVDVMPHPGSSPEVHALVRTSPCASARRHRDGAGKPRLRVQLHAEQPVPAQTLARERCRERGGHRPLLDGCDPHAGRALRAHGQVGLDTVWKITHYWAERLKNPQQLKNADFMKAYVDRGELGAKTGRGFYTYPNPAYQKDDFIIGETEKK